MAISLTKIMLNMQKKVTWGKKSWIKNLFCARNKKKNGKRSTAAVNDKFRASAHRLS